MRMPLSLERQLVQLGQRPLPGSVERLRAVSRPLVTREFCGPCVKGPVRAPKLAQAIPKNVDIRVPSPKVIARGSLAPNWRTARADGGVA